MTSEKRRPVDVPSADELNAAVVPRRASANPVSELKTSSTKIVEPHLSALAELVLRYVAFHSDEILSLSAIYTALKITSGSKKAKLQRELCGAGFTHLESHGASKRMLLYPAGWAYLGLEPPTGLGRGGADHKVDASGVAKMFRAHKAEARIEFEIGPNRKRVDIFVLAKMRIAIEVGLSDPGQELKNIREDLASGVVDLVLSVSNNAAMLSRIKSRVDAAADLNDKQHQIRFYLLKESSDA